MLVHVKSQRQGRDGRDFVQLLLPLLRKCSNMTAETLSTARYGIQIDTEKQEWCCLHQPVNGLKTAQGGSEPTEPTEPTLAYRTYRTY